MRFVFDQVKELLNPGFTTEVAQQVRQEEAVVKAVLDHWSVVILAGLSQYVNRPCAMGRIFEGLNGFPYHGLQAPHLFLNKATARQVGAPQALALLEQLFAERMGAVRTAIAERSGAPVAAVVELLAIAGPLTLSALSERLHKGELTVSGLANLLRLERQCLAKVLDPVVAESAGIPLPLVSEEETSPQTEGLRWALTLGIVLAIGLAVLFAFRQCSG